MRITDIAGASLREYIERKLDRALVGIGYEPDGPQPLSRQRFVHHTGCYVVHFETDDWRELRHHDEFGSEIRTWRARSLPFREDFNVPEIISGIRLYHDARKRQNWIMEDDGPKSNKKWALEQVAKAFAAFGFVVTPVVLTGNTYAFTVTIGGAIGQLTVSIITTGQAAGYFLVTSLATGASWTFVPIIAAGVGIILWIRSKGWLRARDREPTDDN